MPAVLPPYTFWCAGPVCRRLGLPPPLKQSCPSPPCWHADESSSAYDSSVEGDDDGYDPEGDTFHRTGAVGRQQRQRGGWDEQSYGSDASWE